MLIRSLINGKNVIIIGQQLTEEDSKELSNRITKDHIIVNTSRYLIYKTNLNTTNLLYINIDEHKEVQSKYIMENKLKHIRIYDINGSRVIEKPLYSYITKAYNSLKFLPIKLNITLLDILDHKPNSIYITGFTRKNINIKNLLFLNNICKNKNIQFDRTLSKLLNKPQPSPSKPQPPPPPPPKPQPPPPKPQPPPPPPPKPQPPPAKLYPTEEYPVNLPIVNHIKQNNYNNKNKLVLIYNPFCRHSFKMYKMIEDFQKHKIDDRFKIPFIVKENGHNDIEIVPKLTLYKEDKIVKERIGIISPEELYNIIK